MQSKHYQLLLFFAWDGMIRWSTLSPASLVRPYFSYPVNFGYIFSPVFYLKRQIIVFRKLVLFPVLVSQRARYLDRHLLIRSQCVHRKKKNSLSYRDRSREYTWIFMWSVQNQNMPRRISVKIPSMKFHEKLLVGMVLTHADVWMDGHDEASTHIQFANTPENNMWSY